LVLKSRQLRSALKTIYEGGSEVTEDEWRALVGLRRALETAAGRQRRAWLRETLGESGLPQPLRWVIEHRMKRRDFTPEELAAEIWAARESQIVGPKGGPGREKKAGKSPG
jgi:hypothetical protein